MSDAQEGKNEHNKGPVCCPVDDVMRLTDRLSMADCFDMYRTLPTATEDDRAHKTLVEQIFMCLCEDCHNLNSYQRELEREKFHKEDELVFYDQWDEAKKSVHRTYIRCVYPLERACFYFYPHIIRY
jgi:hypothetical protein